MSTRCNVAVILKEKDLNTRLYETKHNYGYVDTKESHPTMEIYIHHDGYPDGVGKYLKKNLTDYESVVNYILEGDRTSAECPYTECGENWENDKPYFWPDIWEDKSDIPEDYLYLFKDDKWYYRFFRDEKHEWKEL